MVSVEKDLCSAVIALLAFASSSASAGVPTYSTFQLQCRANLSANPNEGVFNIPADTFFSNATPSLNDSGRVSINLSMVQASTSQGVWSGINGTGGVVYTSPAGSFVSDSSINAADLIVFPQTSSPTNGLYKYDTATSTSALLTTQPFGATSWGGPIVNNSGHVGFRATTPNGQAYYSFDGGLVLHAAEVSLDPQSPYSFLFSAAFNNNRQIAAHVRLGVVGQTGNSQPDEIRIFNPNGSSVLIAQDRDANISSPYTGFDSSRPAINDSGHVAFIASLQAGGRGIFVSDGTTTTTIATTTTPGVTVIEFFPPAMNNDGLVAFRGRDDLNRYSIFVGDGTTLRQVVREHDLLPSDNGEARIDQNDSSPVFGGSISINSHGDIAFHCSLTPPDNNQIEWGSGLYIAYADNVVVGDITGDGLVNIDDLVQVIVNWGQSKSPADINNDGIVNIDDLVMVIVNWS